MAATPKPIDGGAKITNEWLVVGSLVIDSAYQRPVNERTVSKIVRLFDPDLLGAFLVSRRDSGTEVLLDGQQRREGLLRLHYGDQRVPCVVYHGLSLEREAEIFHQFNVQRTKLGAFDEYRAALVAKDPTALEVQAVIDRVGLRVVRGGEDAFGVQAIASCMTIVKNTSPAVLQLALSTAKRSWANEYGQKAFQGEIIIGLALVFARYKSRISMERMLKQMATVDPSQLVVKGRVIKSELGGSTAGNRGASVLAELIHARYNRGMRNHAKMLPPFERRGGRGYWDEV